MTERAYNLLEDPENPYRLGRHVNHDDQSKAFRVAPAKIIESKNWARAVPIFDQGDLGSCTGNAAVGSVATSFMLGTVAYGGLLSIPTKLGGPSAHIDESVAVDVYSQATVLDPFAGTYPPEDTGSDGLSVAKVLKNAGIIDRYEHGFGLNDLLYALQTGPAIVGVPWYYSMFRPVNGLVSIGSGSSVAGGHEPCAVGLDVPAQEIIFANSWGDSWGINGYFRMSYATTERLLGEDGDVTIFRPKVVTEPVPVPPAPLPECNWFQTLLKLLSAGLYAPRCR